MSELFSLEGRRALITGAARGIGYALGEGLAAHGASVVFSDINADQLEEAGQRLRGAGHTVATAVFDVSDEAAVQAAVAKIEADVGAIDILINNAGIQFRKNLVDVSAAEFQRMLNVHVLGCFNVARAIAPNMIARGHGKIINLASIMAEGARGSTGPYNAAKGAIKLLTKTMCAEWAASGLNINAIGPGFIKTDLTVALHNDVEFNTWLEARVPQARWGTTDDLVGPCVFLAAPASDFVNGQNIVVDGGVTSVF